MKNKILLIALLPFATVSCTTSYRSGQTPDDVYYSPLKHIQDDENDKKKDEEVAQNTEDREIRMKSKDWRWRDLDDRYDCNCDYHPYKYGYTCGYYYNPYYYPYPVHLPTYITSPIRTTNLASYTVTPVTIRDPKTGSIQTLSPSQSYNTSNSSTNRSRRLSLPETGSGSRTYSPSTPTGSSGSSSPGSGSLPVNRPVKH